MLLVFVYCNHVMVIIFFFFFQAEDGIRDVAVTGVQTCALPIYCGAMGSLKRGSIYVDSSTVSPGLARRIAAACSERGVRFLDAPVTGGGRSGEHTPELHSRPQPVCPLLLLKKKHHALVSHHVSR